MSFGLGHGKAIDDAPGVVGISRDELGPLPDEVLTDPEAARIDPRIWFQDPAAPLEIEIGSGKGTFLIQQAELSPETNYLGIEWAGEFYPYAADRVRRRRDADKLLNVRMLRDDATEFLRWRCAPETVRVIHLYFSDPWPKARHHKKRVIQHAFLGDAWRALEPRGELRVVTDHDGLWTWNQAHFQYWTEPGKSNEIPGAESLPDQPFERAEFVRPPSAGEGEMVGTNYERKFRVEGRAFHACTLIKRDTRIKRTHDQTPGSAPRSGGTP